MGRQISFLPSEGKKKVRGERNLSTEEMIERAKESLFARSRKERRKL